MASKLSHRFGPGPLVVLALLSCSTEPMIRGTGLGTGGSGPSTERTGGSGGNTGGNGSPGAGGSGFVLPDAAPGSGPADVAPSEPIPRCGNQVINDGEACDDGNTAAGDGCTPACQVEPGWACADGGVCQAARCGDGLKIGGEQCDDGNAAAGDGCSAACFVESRRPDRGRRLDVPHPRSGLRAHEMRQQHAGGHRAVRRRQQRSRRRLHARFAGASRSARRPAAPATPPAATACCCPPT